MKTISIGQASVDSLMTLMLDTRQYTKPFLVYIPTFRHGSLKQWPTLHSDLKANGNQNTPCGCKKNYQYFSLIFGMARSKQKPFSYPVLNSEKPILLLPTGVIHSLTRR